MRLYLVYRIDPELRESRDAISASSFGTEEEARNVCEEGTGQVRQELWWIDTDRGSAKFLGGYSGGNVVPDQVVSELPFRDTGQ